MSKRYSYFTYGRYDAAVHGWYNQPDGIAARVLYWIGNIVGRRFGPPSL